MAFSKPFALFDNLLYDRITVSSIMKTCLFLCTMFTLGWQTRSKLIIIIIILDFSKQNYSTTLL